MKNCFKKATSALIKIQHRVLKTVQKPKQWAMEWDD